MAIATGEAVAVAIAGPDKLPLRPFLLPLPLPPCDRYGPRFYSALAHSPIMSPSPLNPQTMRLLSRTIRLWMPDEVIVVITISTVMTIHTISMLSPPLSPPLSPYLHTTPYVVPIVLEYPNVLHHQIKPLTSLSYYYPRTSPPIPPHVRCCDATLDFRRVQGTQRRQRPHQPLRRWIPSRRDDYRPCGGVCI